MSSDFREAVFAFTTQAGHSAILRYPTIQDAPEVVNFINEFSKEDRYTRFAGEQVSLDEEKKYLSSEIEAIERGDAVKLFCYVEGKFAGTADIHRDTSLLTRHRHIGIFGIIVGKEFRGEGVGEKLMQATLDEAKKHIQGLRLFKLDCFATNIPAQNLYHKLGFVDVGSIPEALLHKNAYVDEVIMVKKI